MIKVGDKVIAKCNGKTKLAFHPGNGVECTVAKVTKHAVLVQYDGGTAWLRYSEIKRVLQQQKYAPGDEVSVVDFTSSGINYTGHSGVIRAQVGESAYTHSKVYAVTFDDMHTDFIPETALIPLYKDDILVGFIDEYGGESDV